MAMSIKTKNLHRKKNGAKNKASQFHHGVCEVSMSNENRNLSIIPYT